MDTHARYKSISMETQALKNRVRNLIDDAHWLTDGEWKESVLRTILRRHLPSDVGVGRGFVIKLDSCSKQIDILLYDTTKPLLHRDGDLVFVTPDAVKGIIEVKSRISNVSATLNTLAEKAEFIQADIDFDDPVNPPAERFIGLFCYEWERRHDSIMRSLQQKAQGKLTRVINHLSLGDSLFIHYWRFRPELQFVPDAHNRWHCYHMDRQAQGYFINNVVASVARDSVSLNKSVWFPPEGKEGRKISEMPLRKDHKPC